MYADAPDRSIVLDLLASIIAAGKTRTSVYCASGSPAASSVTEKPALITFAFHSVQTRGWIRDSRNRGRVRNGRPRLEPSFSLPSFYPPADRLRYLESSPVSPDYLEMLREIVD